MRAFHLVLILIITGSITADYLYGEHSGEVFTFSETTVFTEADSSSEIAAVLPAGVSIHILDETADAEDDDWYAVSHESTESSVSGFSTPRSFATTGFLIDDSTSFIYQIGEFCPDTGRFPGMARVTVNGIPVAESFLEPVADPWSGNQQYGYTVKSHKADITGFTELQGLFLVEFIYEACGYENRITPVFWNESTLIPGPYASSIFEAGLFQVVSSINLPDGEEILQNEIMITTTEREWDENRGDYQDVSRHEKLFLWNGSELEQL